MALTTSLSPEVLAAFGISGIPDYIPSGQRKVYRVVSEGKIAILKIISSGMASSRLDRELDIYKRFSDQPGIPKVLKLQVIGGNIALLEEFIEGDSLTVGIESYQADSDRIKDLMINLVNILLPVWEKEIVHRDIKPDNIIIRPDGTPALLDFGIAKDFNSESVTEAGFQPLSYMYGAPEQYRGDKTMISYKTDMFSLGVIAYRLFYGRFPFGNNKSEIEQRFQDASRPVDIPANCPIAEFLSSCLALMPTERPRKPSNLLTMLS